MKAVKKLGIIGGMGSRASAQFLQKIVDYSPAITDQDFIEIILHNNSRIPDRTRAIVYNQESPLEELLRSLTLFNSQKVDVIALACVTSYFYAEALATYTEAKIINPVSVACKTISTNYKGVKKVGLLATTGTIKSGLFHKELKKYNIEAITLYDSDQENYFMKSVYMENGLKSAVISDESRNLFYKSIPKLEQLGAELLVGGCSEVQLVLEQSKVNLPFVDAIDVLAKEVVSQCYNL